MHIGRRNCYAKGCRLPQCRAANTRYAAERRQLGMIPPGGSHGVSGYSNYGCRCGICTAAWSAKMRRAWQRRRGTVMLAPFPVAGSRVSCGLRTDLPKRQRRHLWCILGWDTRSKGSEGFQDVLIYACLRCGRDKKL